MLNTPLGAAAGAVVRPTASRQLLRAKKLNSKAVFTPVSPRWEVSEVLLLLSMRSRVGVHTHVRRPDVNLSSLPPMLSVLLGVGRGQALPLKAELGDSAGLAGQEAPETCLSLPPCSPVLGLQAHPFMFRSSYGF